MKNLIISALVLFVAACSGIKPITAKRNVADKIDTSKLYDQEFLKKVNLAKDKYRKGKTDLALKDLTSISEDKLTSTEKASRKNLMGVMLFSKKNYVAAAEEFNQAALMTKEDPYLESQIFLNLGSAYYKMNEPDKALSTLSKGDFKNLSDAEAKKYHQLFAVLSEHMGKKEDSLSAQIRALSDKKTLVELNKDSKFERLTEGYIKLTESEKVHLLEEFDQEKSIVIPALALKEMDIANREGNKEKVQNYSEWIQKRYSDNPEVMEKVNLLSVLAINLDVKVNAKLIGVALPLSGERKGLGERALNGIDVALMELNTDPANAIQIEVKDTQSSVAEGAFAVSELIEKNNVVAVVGGLVPSSATKEYLEAKKRGVLFISLSPVYLPKEEKNNLLIEIPGSVESQVDQVFSDKIINNLGKRPAIIYPRTELGEAYVNEFWRRAKKLNLDVTGIVSYDKNASDFKEPIKNLLGIKFEREREEEAQVVNDIAYLERNKNVKRLQNLQPQIDFDWVFAPGLPKEMVQVLPNFNYFDAFNLSYIGVPSWRSELMTNEGYRFGNVYFIDENIKLDESLFTKNFTEKFNHAPKIVETVAYDALKILGTVLDPKNAPQSRKDIDTILSKNISFSGESGSWKLDDGIWLKNMSLFKIKREGIEAF
jgi:outer membrane PBP1 activator LpoA protein